MGFNLTKQCLVQPNLPRLACTFSVKHQARSHVMCASRDGIPKNSGSFSGEDRCGFWTQIDHYARRSLSRHAYWEPETSPLAGALRRFATFCLELVDFPIQNSALSGHRECASIVIIHRRITGNDFRSQPCGVGRSPLSRQSKSGPISCNGPISCKSKVRQQPQRPAIVAASTSLGANFAGVKVGKTQFLGKDTLHDYSFCRCHIN